MANPQPVVEVPQADAPVEQVVLAGDDVDLRGCCSTCSTPMMVRRISPRLSTTRSI